MILAQRTPLPPPLVAGEIVQAPWGFVLVLAALRELLAVMRCRMSARLLVCGPVVRKLAWSSAASPWQRDILLACICMQRHLVAAAAAACTMGFWVMITCDDDCLFGL